MAFEGPSSLSESDAEWMERAFAMAEEALANDEVPVGCVFVYDGREIGCGRNDVNRTHDPTRHPRNGRFGKDATAGAEPQRGNVSTMLTECTLFVTLEPCIMCASGLYPLGVRRIVYGADNDRFGGMRSVGSAEKYNENGEAIQVVAGVHAERAVQLLRTFYDKQNPFVPEEKRKIKKKKV